MTLDPRLTLILVLLASPLTVLALNVAAHWTLRALGRPFVAQKTVFFCAIGANIPVLAAAWGLALRHLADPVELAFGWLFALALHNALACFYYQCFSLSETSLHIHALTEVYLGRQPQPQPEQGLDEAVSVRLDRLVELGQARLVDGRYVSSGGIFLHVARLFDLWRWLIGCGGGGRRG